MCHTDLSKPGCTAQSQVPVPYLRIDQLQRWKDARPIPYEERLPAIAYIQSNCRAPHSPRQQIVKELMEIAGGTVLPVHAMGACLRNVPGRIANKIEKYRQ